MGTDVAHNPFVICMVLIGYFASFCALVCCGQDKKVPLNYFLLALFTFCMSFFVGIITVRFEPKTVLEAACLTAAAVIGITIYAVRTKTDFTTCGPMLFVIGMIFFTTTILACFFGLHKNLFYNLIGVFMFTLYLISDTQAIVGG